MKLPRIRLPRLPLDTWDILGAAGFVALTRGTWLHYGEAVAEMLAGGLVVAAYAYREVVWSSRVERAANGQEATG